jgi:hypothetical protein
LSTNRGCPTLDRAAGTGTVDEVVEGLATEVDDVGEAPPGVVVGAVDGWARAGVGLPANDSRPSATTKATRAAGRRSRLRITV